MKITLRKFHKYISLIVSIQLLLWTISGIYFSFNKIENVRGEQYRLENNASAADEKKQTEMLSTEDAKKIVSLKTTLVPIQVILIDEEKRGSEFRGRVLPLYKVISKNERSKCRVSVELECSFSAGHGVCRTGGLFQSRARATRFY